MIYYDLKGPRRLYFYRREERGPMVLALNDSNRIAKDLNFKALKVFSDFCIPSNMPLRLYCSQSSFRFSITSHWEVSLCGCSSDVYTFLHNLFWVCTSWLMAI